MKIDSSNIICKAELLYSDSKKYHAIIIEKNLMPGTGDYEDPDEIQNDRITKCYMVLFEDLANPDNYNSGIYKMTLADAKETIEQTLGFRKWNM